MRIILALLFIAQFAPLLAQDDRRSMEVPLVEVLQTIEEQQGVRIWYQEEWLQDQIATPDIESDSSLNARLAAVLRGTGVDFKIYDRFNVILYPLQNQVKGNVPSNGVIPEVTLSGRVYEETSEEPIAGAAVTIDDLQLGVLSDVDGSYSLTVPAGEHQLSIRYVGFHTLRQKLNLTQNTVQNLYLYDQVTELSEIIIGSEALDQNISSVNMGATRLDISSIKKLPVLMGEVDVVRGILSLPGVQSVGEGASGFNVRGGGIDQNLILMDGAPIFNPSHVFGFFSIFNPDAVKDVTLFKGGIPTKYGGRLSSVLDVQLKEGDPNNHSIKGGIGVFASRIGVEGPLIRNKTTYSFSARASYSDWALGLFESRGISNSSASFYDFSGKISHRIGEKDRIVATGYLSSDDFKLVNDTIYDWQSQVASLNWHHSFNPSLTSNLLLTYSDYQYGINSISRGNEFDWQAGVNHQSVLYNVNNIFSERSKMDFGAQLEWYDFSPGSLEPIGDSPINPVDLEKDHARSYAAFASHEYNFSTRLSVQYGLRFAIYQNVGPGTEYHYAEDMPRELDTIEDSTSYGKGEVIKTYPSLEPRVSLRFGLQSDDAIKLSYNRMRQNVHLISNSTASTPVDIWQTSNSNITPQTADQISLGYFRNFSSNTIETSAEVYYKAIDDLVEYRDGATIILNRNIETDLLQGKGRSYGFELLAKKKKGLFTGWFAYTYSRTQRKVVGDTPEETINFGNYFPANFDKPHDFTLVTNYQVTRRLSFSTNFTLSTGRPVTFPDSQYRINRLGVANFRERNQGRIPDYHRLDVAITLEGNHRKNKKWEGSWTFSVYNLYNRDNAFSIFFRSIRAGTQPQAFKLSVIGSVFPSLTYNFRFKP